MAVRAKQWVLIELFDFSTGRRSFLRHAGLAQAGEIGGFVQSANLWYPEIPAGYHASDAGIKSVGAQLSRFGERRRSASYLALKGVGGSQITLRQRGRRVRPASSLEPQDRLVRA